MSDESDVLIPDLSEAQLQALDKMFPERCADPEWTDREVWLRSGERRVVRFLWEQYRRQTETILAE